MYLPICINNEMIGRRIARRRLELRISTEELAMWVSISESLMDNIEAGKVLPTIEVLAGISHFLDISMDYLILGVKNRCVMEECPVFDEMQEIMRRFKAERGGGA